MSFDSRETSTAEGVPVRLYQFNRGSQVWRYTSANQDIAHDNQVFFSLPALEDDGLRQTGEASADNLSIDLPLGTDLVDQYRIYPPNTPISVTIFEKHIGDGEAIVQWVGEVNDVQHRRNLARLVCGPFVLSSDSTGLHLTWDRNCPYFVYDHNCRVNKADHGVTTVLSNNSGYTVYTDDAANQDDGFYSGGLIEYQGKSGLTESHGIRTHIGDSLLLATSSVELIQGKTVTIYPGCPKTIDICDSRFNNRLNCGAIPGLPGESPFDGNPIF